MKNTLEDILGIPQCSCLTLISGEAGLKRRVRWIVSIEVIEVTDFIDEGDLIFVSGIATCDEEQLLLLTCLGYDRNASGIVFAPGPYIPQIPQCVIDFSNSHNFPVFSIPWEVRLSRLSYAIAEYLLQNNTKFQHAHEILKSIILKREPLPLSSNVKNQLNYYSFQKNSLYRVLLFKTVTKKKSDDASQLMKEEELTMLKQAHETILNEISRIYSIDTIPIQFPSSIAFVLTNNSAKRIIEEDLIDDLQNISYKTHNQFDNLCVRIGIGNQYQKIEDIGKSYEEALQVTELLTSEIQLRKVLFRYDQLGAYRVILENKNFESMERFYRDILGPLEAKDGLNKNNLIHFLYDYFDFNGNVGEISKQRFLHRNTVLYKIKKIEKVLNCSFLNTNDLLNVKLALMIREIIYNKN